MKKLTLAALLAASVCTNSYANNEFEIGITALVFGQNSLYLEGENQTSVVPLLDVYWGDFFVSQGNIGYTFVDNPNFSISAGLNHGFMADIDRGDSPRLKDMKKLNESVNAFIETKLKQSWGNISFTYLADISDEHDGDLYSINFEKEFITGNWFYTPSISATLSDEQIVNYFYGVTKQETLPDRPSYTADSSWSISATMLFGYAFDHHNTVFAFVSGSWFDKQVDDSPITESDHLVSLGVGYQYWF